MENLFPYGTLVCENIGLGSNVGHYNCFLTHNLNRNHNRRALE